jgi:hypothetical protein
MIDKTQIETTSLLDVSKADIRADIVFCRLVPTPDLDGSAAKRCTDALRARDARYLAPPTRTRMCGLPAYASDLGSKRKWLCRSVLAR